MNYVNQTSYLGKLRKNRTYDCRLVTAWGPIDGMTFYHYLKFTAKRSSGYYSADTYQNRDSADDFEEIRQMGFGNRVGTSLTK